MPRGSRPTPPLNSFAGLKPERASASGTPTGGVPRRAGAAHLWGGQRWLWRCGRRTARAWVVLARRRDQERFARALLPRQAEEPIGTASPDRTGDL
jgi:hypothetical protein